MSTQSIYIGDRFKDENGTVWKVINTLPGGKLDLFDETKTRFAMYYHRQVKTWERI